MQRGIYTSEFYLVIAAALVSVGGMILQATPDQQAEASRHLSAAITSVVGLVAYAVTAWRYIASREALKIVESDKTSPPDAGADGTE